MVWNRHIFFVLSCSISLTLVWGDWTQQYGDYRSTNYGQVDPTSELYNITFAWNYTYPGPHSYIYNSPAVSENGVVFLPYLNYAPPHDGVITYGLEVRAISPNGSLIWVSPDFEIDFMCAVIFLTNAVYVAEKKSVLIAWTCANVFPYYEKHGRMAGIDSVTGKILWKSQKLYDANDMSRLSVVSDVVYASGGYDCWKDELPVHTKSSSNNSKQLKLGDDPPNNISRIYAFNANNGSIIWVRDYAHVGCTSQTKLFPLPNNKHMVIFPVNLPNTVYLGGKLLAMECNSQGSCVDKWLSDVKTCWDSTFAFSDQGTLFGGYGFDGVPDLIFGLDSTTGKISFSSIGHCEPGTYPSGPVVDKMGRAYYSCGNRVFGVNSKGELLWKTDIETGPGYIFYSAHRFSPALVPRTNDMNYDILVTMNTNSSHLYALSTNNGSVVGDAAIPVLPNDQGISERPFAAGNRVYWIKRHYGDKLYLFSAPMDMLFGIRNGTMY